MRTVLGRVLVIDDDPFALKVICDLLEHAGYNVLVQGSASGATQMIVRERVDAAVIDWNLPDMAGDELIRLLRTWDQIKDLPVLLVTGAPDETIERIREQLPGVRVLAKEQLRQQLVSTLGAVVGSGMTMRGLTPINATRGERVPPSRPAKENDLVAQLLKQLAGAMPLVREVWQEATRGQSERVGELVQTLELLAGQARLLALTEVASLVQALADTLNALSSRRKISRDVRRAVEGGVAALAALAEDGDGTLTTPPEPLIVALQRARTELSA